MAERAETAISLMPTSRLGCRLYFHPEKGRIGSTCTEHSGLVPETPFDHNRFPIPDELISTYDSVHLRMLEVCCETVVSTGMDPLSGLAGTCTGVSIGNTLADGPHNRAPVDGSDIQITGLRIRRFSGRCACTSDPVHDRPHPRKHATRNASGGPNAVSFEIFVKSAQTTLHRACHFF